MLIECGYPMCDGLKPDASVGYIRETRGRAGHPPYTPFLYRTTGLPHSSHSRPEVNVTLFEDISRLGRN